MDRLLIWNVRGINSPNKHKDIKRLMDLQQPGLICLLETKIKNKDMGKLYLSLFSGWCFTNNNPWLDKGRIILAWIPNIFEVTILRCSHQLIHCHIRKCQTKEEFLLSLLYGVNDEGGRAELWDDLKDIAKTVIYPWMVAGDFNEILYLEERVGKRSKRKLNEQFINCIAECGLEDLKFSGSYYTWNNKQQGDDRVYSKIDRAMVNQHWENYFVNSEVNFLPEGVFDHCPIMVSFYQTAVNCRRPFRYFKMWKFDKQYDALVAHSWKMEVKGSPMFQIVTKLKRLKVVLKKLNKTCFGELHVAEVKARTNMMMLQEQLREEPFNTGLIMQEKEARPIHRSIRHI